MWWLRTVCVLIMTSSLDSLHVNAKKVVNMKDVMAEHMARKVFKNVPEILYDLGLITAIPKKRRRLPLTSPTTTQRPSTTVKPEIMLFDFTTLETLDMWWYEISDVARYQGMSKAIFVLHKTDLFQRAVFFTLLNPQPNGAGFASYRVDINLDLSNYKKIQIYCHGQGENSVYKLILRHRKQNKEPFPSYEQMFQAPMEKFQIVELQLANFEPYIRGQKFNSSEPLDLAAITSMEFQVCSEVYLPIKQSGTSSLEIEWIKALV